MKEDDFWEMSIRSVNRQIKAYNKNYKRSLKEKATFDYLLAELFGASIAQLLSKNSKFPKIEDVYPELFEDETQARQEKEQQQKLDISAQRFLQYAANHNLKFKKNKAGENEE